MFFKFDNIVGRIVRSSQIEAYTPQGLSPLKRTPPVIVFDSVTTHAVHEPPVSSAHPVAAAGSIPKVSSAANLTEAHGIVPANPRYRRIMEMQNQFLKEDGRLVWQKLGSRDRASYYVTLGLVVVGTVLSFNVLFQMSFPKRSEE